MKFLLELVSCCGCQESSGDANTVPERPSDTSSLVPVVRRSYRRRRKGSFSGGDGRHVDDWQPSLCAISEDNVVVEGNKSDSAERVVKRKSDGFHRDTVRVRSYNKDFGKYSSLPTFIPAFSPTPFMF